MFMQAPIYACVPTTQEARPHGTQVPKSLGSRLFKVILNNSELEDSYPAVRSPGRRSVNPLTRKPEDAVPRRWPSVRTRSRQMVTATAPNISPRSLGIVELSGSMAPARG